MKCYKLLKDLPTFKAGQLAYISKTGNLIAGTPENQKTTETGLIIMIYHETTLKKFPNILTEWFEEIEEPTDSIHWKPKKGDKYFCFGNDGQIFSVFWADAACDDIRLELGNVYRTKEECKKVRERRLAEVRLRRTSTFKPDFENDIGGWVVYYDYGCETLAAVCGFDCYDAGEPVRYATREEAKKSIEENEQDWKIYFGVKEEK